MFRHEYYIVFVSFLFQERKLMKINSNVLTQSYERKKPIQEKTSQYKPYEELNLMDSFLFESVTEKPESAVVIAREIIECTTGQKVGKLIVHSQKDLKGINVNMHGIRMDVYTEEVQETKDGDRLTCVYDIEPNNYYDKNIARRNRYYQSMIDSKLLPAGELYKNLPDMFSIWILPYDPFGDNRMIYTVKNTVTENNQIVYNDGITKIYLYTKGKIGGSEELKNLLRFMENSIHDNAVDDELSEIMDIVDTIKSNLEERKRYMGLMGVIEYERRDAYEEGQVAGAIKAYKFMKADKESVKKAIMEQFELASSDAEEYMKRYWDEEAQ